MTSRVLIAGDTHGDLRWIQTLTKHAVRNACQRLVILGDFGFWTDSRTEHGLNTGWLAAVNKKLVWAGIEGTVIDGNHDNHPAARAAHPADEHGCRRIDTNLVWADRGAELNWDGVRIGTLGGAVSIDRDHLRPGISWWDTEAVTYAEADRLVTKGSFDVLFTHEAPASARTPFRHHYDGPAAADCGGQRRLIEAVVEHCAPKLLLHGHHHVRYTDVIVGPGRQTIVEGFASNVERDGRAWGILELPSLKIINGFQRRATHR